MSANPGPKIPRYAFRFRDELKAIRQAMGEDAPPEDAHVALLARGDRCFFAVGNAVLTWSDNTAWRVHEAHGSERYEGWRDGKKIGTIDPPREAHWN